MQEHHVSFGIQYKIDSDRTEAIARQFTDIFPRTDQRVYIAVSDGNVVGMLMAKIVNREEMFIYKKVGYIGGTVVSKNFRGKNIGSALVDAAHKWFRSEAVDFFELMVDAHNENSIAFWKSKGYEVQLLKMAASPPELYE